MKILIADDSEISLMILTNSLKKLGHDAVSARSGEQAITIFMHEQPDLVILDVLMQPINGFECAKKLRKINPDDWTPIIFLSAAVDDNSIAQGIDAGGDDYLSKPYSEIRLAAKIKAMQRIADMQKKLYAATCKLSVLSSTDALTGLDNCLQFNKSLRESIAYANRYDVKLALLFLDLDHFKIINDHLGHHVGDTLLREVAKRLKACLRENDILARLGGDEFAIILNKINHPKEASRVAQKILSVFNPAYNLSEHIVHISCSIGIACYPKSGTTCEALVQHADMAMYHAKELGRNNFQHYVEGLQLQHKQRLTLESALRFALDNNELYMSYQPIFQLRTKKLVAMEAIMRWKNPTLGLVEPDVFIPLAEDMGFITNMGKWAFRKTCEQAAIWYKEGYKNFRFSVNISLHQLLHLDFLDLVKATLKETRLPPNLLECELTESGVMSPSSIIEKNIRKLSEMNVNVSLDHFGTGYSSLSHLKSLPITSLKIDKSFVMDISNDKNDALIVKSIISLGKTFQLNLIAEGIESREQLEFLIDNHCDEGQGLYLSAPLNAEEMGQLLRQEHDKRKS